MLPRQCFKHVFPAEGSSSSILHGPGSRGAGSRGRTTLNFHRCCVRASLWRTDHLHISTARSSEIKVHTLLQVPDVFNTIKSWSKLQLVTVTGLAACVVLLVPSAGATDALKTCTCLLKECRIELAKCIANPSCAANVACLNTCNNRPDETECQIKCGDLFENSVVDEFNECAVSRKKCVPKKSDVGEFPVPDPSALVKNFNMADFRGKWYISSGLNPTFDNEYLHYQDDWYILSSKIENKDDDYIFVYYRGRNDAWDGYGGAVVYTRSKELPETIVPELERAAKSVGRDFSTFIRTDNTCGAEPPLADRIERTVEKGEKLIVDEVKEIEGEIEGEVKELEREEETLVKRLADGIMEVKQDVMNFFQGLSKEEMEILDQLNLEATEVEELFSRSLPIRKLR
ncbi:unnamed protein product [Triticum turgidum subsp. durum]|uniref:VDE lipocalin domain-containing protein n=1 Tax=Triticum turgidum subsp. durum TaxID=4567 RepID=A0A9R1PPI5_TRITD|nr:unnamed protein product [Triticum turgidum subsp. durum]